MVVEHKHLLVQASTLIPPSTEKDTEDWVSNLIKNLGMQALIEPKAVYCSTEGNRGMTCISAIETSHIVIHAWDEEEEGKIQLDVYTCSKLDLQVVWQALDVFDAYDIRYKFYDRDNGFRLIKDTNIENIEQNLLDNVWHFAKSMPKIPHWYTRGREWSNHNDFVQAVRLINARGRAEVWNNREYIYYYIGDYKYWTMEEPDVAFKDHILINRAKM